MYLELKLADTEHVNQSGFEDLLCEFCACVFLTGLSESCLDELALEYLFPLPLLHNYVRLVRTHTLIHANTHKGLRGIRWVRRSKIGRKLEDCTKRMLEKEAGKRKMKWWADKRKLGGLKWSDSYSAPSWLKRRNKSLRESKWVFVIRILHFTRAIKRMIAQWQYTQRNCRISSPFHYWFTFLTVSWCFNPQWLESLTVKSVSQLRSLL